MICPKCKTEYPDDVKTCATCNVPLVPSLENPESEDWTIVYTTDAEYKADMLKANLEGAGIETLIIKQKDTSFPAVGNLAVVKVIVPASKSQDALAIIEDINKQAPDAADE